MRATVLIPTLDHGPTLRYAARSALEQTVSDLEVLIVGDGASDETRDVAMTLEKEDERVRFFDNPKGPRHGEIHRHAALLQARGEFVFYLSDDDLWLPSHVETLAEALGSADLAHTMTAWIHADGSIHAFFGNVADARPRRRLLSDRWNFIPLSAAAHTMDAYRRLDEGWQTTPDDLWTDLQMWRRFLRDDGTRAASVPVPTVVHFASAERKDWTPEERLAELARFASDLGDPLKRSDLALRVHEAAMHDAHAELVRIGNRMDGFERRRDELQGQIAWLDEALAKARADREALNELVGRMKRTATWRLRERLLRNRVVRAMHRRRAARARSR